MTLSSQWAKYGERLPDEMGLEPWNFTPAQKREAKRFMYKGVAIAGKIASGKTSLANYLTYWSTKPPVHFAQALKDDVAEALYCAGLAAEQNVIINTYKGKLRATLQEWGSIFRELNGEDYWVERLFKLNRLPFVIDDVRYKNELEACKRKGLLTVRLEVHKTQQLMRIEDLYPDMKLAQLTHVSETDLDDSLSEFDVVIPPLDSLAELYAYWDERVAPRFDVEWRS